MIDKFFWWLGCMISAVGGIGVFVVVAWWALDKAYTNFGHLKTFLEVYRRMLQERRSARAAR